MHRGSDGDTWVTQIFVSLHTLLKKNNKQPAGEQAQMVTVLGSRSIRKGGVWSGVSKPS